MVDRVVRQLSSVMRVWKIKARQNDNKDFGFRVRYGKLLVLARIFRHVCIHLTLLVCNSATQIRHAYECCLF